MICSDCGCKEYLHHAEGCHSCDIGCRGFTQEPGGSHSSVCTHRLGHKPFCYGVVLDKNGIWVCWYPPGHPNSTPTPHEPAQVSGRVIDLS